MNKYILLVMRWLNNKDSVTQEELKENYYAADAAADASYAVDASYAYTYAAAYAADAYAYAAEKWVNKYFERTGEDKQDYINELNKDEG